MTKRFGYMERVNCSPLRVHSVPVSSDRKKPELNIAPVLMA